MAKKKTTPAKKTKKTLVKKANPKMVCDNLIGNPFKFGDWVKGPRAKIEHDAWFRRTYGPNPDPLSVKAIAFGKEKINILLNDRFPDWQGIRIYFCDVTVQGKKYTDAFLVPIDANGKDMISLKKKEDEVLNTSTLCPIICKKNFML